MTTFIEANVIRRPYTEGPSTAPRRVEAISLADVKGVVFVVDDDVSVRESLELLLTSTGWQPRVFESAQKFL
jgi:hypothetical protein